MAQFEKHFVQDLTQDIKVRQGGTIVFNNDNLSNVVGVALYNGKVPASVSGTVVGAVIAPDGATVPVDNGTISGNIVSITLTRACFALPGNIGVGIQVVTGDVATTVLKVIYNVELFSTDTIVDPDSRITLSLAEIQAKLDEIPTILANAQTAIDGIEAQKDTMIASIASVAGQGTDTTLTQSGVAADAKATGDQVRDLKSAIGNLNNLDTTDKSSIVGALNETYGLFTGAVDDAVADWLDDHPEATTTVQDGSLTEAKFTSTLKLKTVKDYVTPELFGAVGDGTTDDTTAMRSAITYCENNNFALLLTKTYLITSELLTSGISIFGNGHGTLKFNNVNATLHFSQTAPVVGDASKLFVVDGIIIDCNNVANFGINSDAYRVRYNNINIVNVHFYGIKLTTGYENVFSDIHISTSAPGTTGIFSMVGDNEFYNISMVDVQTAIHEYRNGGSLYARIHPWIYNPDYLNGSVFFKVSAWTCSILTDCVSDTFQTAFWFINGTSSNLQVNGFKHIMNSSITTASGITSNPIYWIYYDTAPSNPVYEMRIRFSQCFASDYILLHGWTFNESNLSEQWAIYDDTCNLNFSDRTDCRNIQRTISPTNITASKAQIFLNGSIANLIIEGTPDSSILNTDAKILDLSTPEMSIFFPDDKYRIPVYYSTANAWTLDGVAFGYLQLFTDAGANRHLYLNVKLPSTAKYMVINTNYHVLPTKFR